MVWRLMQISILVAVARVPDGQILVMLSSDDDWATAYEQSHVETDGNATTVAIRGVTQLFTLKAISP